MQNHGTINPKVFAADKQAWASRIAEKDRMTDAMKDGAANQAERNQVHRELRQEIPKLKDTRAPSKQQSALPEMDQLKAFALKSGFSA